LLAERRIPDDAEAEAGDGGDQDWKKTKDGSASSVALGRMARRNSHGAARDAILYGKLRKPAKKLLSLAAEGRRAPLTSR